MLVILPCFYKSTNNNQHQVCVGLESTGRTESGMRIAQGRTKVGGGGDDDDDSEEGEEATFGHLKLLTEKLIPLLLLLSLRFHR